MQILVYKNIVKLSDLYHNNISRDEYYYGVKLPMKWWKEEKDFKHSWFIFKKKCGTVFTGKRKW